ncbi:TRAFs-binding domain-containing protein [Terrisporobacter hibernicus]|uniref:TRAFs-binding domain-containing protein n=1 Tax=Terrisporobacter hibernicus TaxID=2813371 RepID=A0AAX2ZLC6_9FIRM|nr:TRAFs-binding domain-containing protein [Terrisporobacter hibernicus]UEL49167.1 TRAFs-binding domain-containing protein [Terrisporobacter hibernicus]
MKKMCFVVMGYGQKVDYKTGRTLDLDKTYNNILKPMIEELGMDCIRSDEIIHSGIIDKTMFNQLISADIVIADVSTYNPNSFYELGVRHALKPYTTIIISEDKLEYPFDIQHSVIYKYEHLGKDIGYSEVIRFKNKLKESIENILSNPEIDSPVYTYLENLNPPILKNVKLNNYTGEDTLRCMINSGEESIRLSNFYEAKSFFKKALEMDKNNLYILQRLVLSTYKSKYPTEKDSLIESLQIIECLSLDTSNDPEILGLASSINKRLWEINKDNSLLSKAIAYSERAFYISNDYYNGINLAFLFDLRASITNRDDSIADRVIARRIREKVISICLKIIDKNFEERNDCYWVVATLEEAYFGINNVEKYLEYKNKAVEYLKEGWQLESTEEQLKKLENLLSKH